VRPWPAVPLHFVLVLFSKLISSATGPVVNDAPPTRSDDWLTQCRVHCIQAGSKLSASLHSEGKRRREPKPAPSPLLLGMDALQPLPPRTAAERNRAAEVTVSLSAAAGAIGHRLIACGVRASTPC
jgi:hypothetical protein